MLWQGRALVEIVFINDGVDSLAFTEIAFPDRRQPPFCFQPFQHQVYQVDTEHQWRIDPVVGFSLGQIIEHPGCFRARTSQQVFPDNNDDQPGRAKVLLSAGVDHSVPVYVYWPGEKFRGHIRHQGNVTAVRVCLVLDAVGSLIGGDVAITEVSRQAPVVTRRNLIKTGIG